jgi:hypothetical protein
MPILGRAGESLSTRIFGKNGVFNLGQGAKNIASGGAGYVVDRVKKAANTAGGFLGPKAQAAGPEEYSNDNQGGNSDSGNNGVSVQSLGDIKSSGASQSSIDAQNKKNQIAALTAGWDDTDDSIEETEKALKSLGNSISSGLGKARDAYLGAAKNKLDKTNSAIAGNRELITKNQTKDLKDLAEEVRNSIFNTNINLGAAAGSSASQAAAKALSKAAGKNRATVLTGYGDKISTENQNEKNAVEEYEMQRKNIYDWEERNRKQLTEEYEDEKKVLDKLKDKVPSWKKKDIEALQDKNLSKFVSGLQSIYSAAKGYRDTLSAIITDMYGQSDELEAAGIGINPPAALDTPVFDENLEMPAEGETDESAEDFYNPKVKNKKRQGTDILGNPFYVEGEE